MPNNTNLCITHSFTDITINWYCIYNCIRLKSIILSPSIVSVSKSVNIKSPCKTPLIFNLENSASATLNFAFKSPDKSASISAFDLYNLGLTLNTDFFATKTYHQMGQYQPKILSTCPIFYSHIDFRPRVTRDPYL